MTTIKFDSHADCTLCPLHEVCRNPGISTRPATGCVPGTHKLAILVVGSAPGYREDQLNQSWVGRTGALWADILEASELPTVADIYLTNAARCCPGQGEEPSRGQYHSCSPYLLHDICLLQRHYPSNVVLLLLGGIACQAVLNCSLKIALSRKGQVQAPYVMKKFQSTAEIPEPLPVFATNHPAYLLRREPGLIYVMKDHLAHMLRALQDAPNLFNPVPDAPPYTLAPSAPPDPFPSLLSLDIETYGAVARYDQSVFHPAKMVAIDGIKPHDIVQTVALAYIDPLGDERAVVFDWQNEQHRKRLYPWFKALAGHALLGQNLLFDLMTLRYVDPIIRHLTPTRSFILEDVILWNFLHNELRPERGLKDFAALFALADYRSYVNVFNALSSTDPALLAYNVLDAVTNLRARAALRAAILRDYSPATAKLSSECRAHCSDLLWVALHQDETGVTVSIPALNALHQEKLAAQQFVAKQAEEHEGYRLHGVGSQKSLQALVDRAASEAGLLSPLDPRLTLTKKKKLVATSEDNITLFLDTLPTDSALRQPLALLRQFREHQKITSTYTGPLLQQPKRGIVTRLRANGIEVGLTFPSWYPCPSRHDLDKEKEGGTVQGRITCKGPALQTSPDSVKALRCSRFEGGVLIEPDLSQIELRVNALLSGDPVMLREYELGLDRHALTGDMIYSVLFPGHPDDEFMALGKGGPLYDLIRQAGKTTNFLITYEGQARKLQETLLKDLGKKIAELGLPIPTLLDCQNIITAFDQRYQVLRRWQGALIEQASRDHYVELISGWSRIFVGHPSFVAGKHRSRVVDFPIQTIAAQFLEQSQALILSDLDRLRLHTVMPMQTYDSALLDVYPGERRLIEDLLARHLPHPPLLHQIEQQLGRTVPVTYEVKEISHVAG